MWINLKKINYFDPIGSSFGIISNKKHKFCFNIAYEYFSYPNKFKTSGLFNKIKYRKDSLINFNNIKIYYIYAVK